VFHVVAKVLVFKITQNGVIHRQFRAEADIF